LIIHVADSLSRCRACWADRRRAVVGLIDVGLIDVGLSSG
jgi:hypothetical protein